VSTHNIKANYQQPYTVTINDVARGTYIVKVTAKGKVVSKRVLVGE
jgi:hypothetical protein